MVLQGFGHNLVPRVHAKNKPATEKSNFISGRLLLNVQEEVVNYYIKGVTTSWTYTVLRRKKIFVDVEKNNANYLSRISLNFSYL